jgi:hypothetical protein
MKKAVPDQRSILMRRLILTALLVSAASAAGAQDAGWSNVKSCSVTSPEATGTPRVRLTAQVIGKETFLSLHLITADAPTEKPEKFGGAKITIDPMGTEFPDLYGWTSLGAENLVGLGVTAAMPKFLDAVAAGNEMKIGLTVAGKDESFAIPLTGSGAAVATLRRCLR